MTSRFFIRFQKRWSAESRTVAGFRHRQKSALLLVLFRCLHGHASRRTPARPVGALEHRDGNGMAQCLMKEESLPPSLHAYSLSAFMHVSLEFSPHRLLIV